MITINRAYIKVNSKKDRNIIEEMLQEAFEKLDIEWKNDVANLVVYETDSFQLQLMKLLHFNLQDLGIKANVLIVPFFNEVFIKYLNKMNDGVITAFEAFLNNINDPKTKEDAKYIFEMIPKKDLDTIRAFLSCNANSCMAANELYLHRNSFNYRMNHFIDKTQIDIRDLNSLMFLNLIINICA